MGELVVGEREEERMKKRKRSENEKTRKREKEKGKKRRNWMVRVEERAASRVVFGGGLGAA